MSQWWVHHTDPHLAVLLDVAAGPMGACDPVEGHRGDQYSFLPEKPAGTIPVEALENPPEG